MKKLLIEDAIKLAKSKNGLCLSKEYTNSGTKDVLCAACKEFHYFKQIAEKYNVSSQTVVKYCKKFNIYPNKPTSNNKA